MANYTIEMWDKVSRGKSVEYDLTKFTDDELDNFLTDVINETEGHREGSKIYEYLSDVYMDIDAEIQARKNDPRWEVRIDYSSGEEEDPVGDFPTKEEAFKKACELAGKEAYIQNEEFDFDCTCNVFFDAANLAIDLTYSYDGMVCYYRVARKEVAA